MQNFCFLGSKIDFGSGRSNLGHNLVFADVFFHTLWTCLDGNSFSSYILVSGALPCGLLYPGYGGTNAPNFAS